MGFHARHRAGFSLVEVMVAIGLSGLVVGTAVVAFRDSIVNQATAKHEWVAFSIAQQRMELLASIPTSSLALVQNTTSAIDAGTDADAVCDMPLGSQHFRVNDLGVPTADGVYELCWRVTDGSPSAALKNIRVVVKYPVFSGSRHVIVQTIR
jgi:prepilin-type N-terminal cleavage/methylation domain-containing protein